MVRILGLGDNVCDMYVNQLQMYPGGQALNVAVFAKMLGAHAEYMGVFGDDFVAACVKGALKTKGVPFPMARDEQGTNGYALVRLEEGERVFIGSNKGGVAREKPLKLTQADMDYIRSFDLVHTSNNSHFDEALLALDARDTLVSYDFSGTWRDVERVERLCPKLDYAFLSFGKTPWEEVQATCQMMRNMGCGAVIATMGDRGAMYVDGAGSLHQAPDYVKAVDTLGAGDSFAAALLTNLAPLGKPPREGFLDRDSVLEALRCAAKFSAHCCLTHGAFGLGSAITNEQAEHALAGIMQQ